MDQVSATRECDFQQRRKGIDFPTKVLVVVCVCVQTSLLAWGAWRQSPTCNEVAHLAAGVSYWQFGRFDVYRVNPPLTRLVAAAPCLLTGCATNWASFYDAPGARPEWEIGKDFIAANRERSLWLYTIARWACLPFSWLGAWVCFRWARELYGDTAGLLALALWCFEPNILAHGQLVTPDAGATALGLAASYCFWRWLKTPTWPRTVLTGGVLGLAELTKFTWLILFVLWPILWLAWRLTLRCGPLGRTRGTGRQTRGVCLGATPSDPPAARRAATPWLREAAQVMLILFLALYVINLGYGFEGSFQPLRKFQFVSEALAETDVVEGQPVAQPGTNRFAKSRLGDLRIPLPSNFVLGLDVQKRTSSTFPVARMCADNFGSAVGGGFICTVWRSKCRWASGCCWSSRSGHRRSEPRRDVDRRREANRRGATFLRWWRPPRPFWLSSARTPRSPSICATCSPLFPSPSSGSVESPH